MSRRFAWWSGSHARRDVPRSWGVPAPSMFDRWIANPWNHVTSVVAPALQPSQIGIRKPHQARQGLSAWAAAMVAP